MVISVPGKGLMVHGAAHYKSGPWELGWVGGGTAPDPSKLPGPRFIVRSTVDH